MPDRANHAHRSFRSISIRMGRARNVVFLGFALGAASSCDAVAPNDMPPIDSTTVASSDVAARLDPLRTYEYNHVGGRPDSILTALWTGGLGVEEAWRSLNYVCLDIRGPRFAVALEAPNDSHMAEHHFEPGNGRLECSRQLRQYVIGIPAGSFYVTGTVRFISVEGGCWALRVNEGLQYEPLGLPVAFRENGLRVRALLMPRDDLASICMVGRIVEVLEVQRR